MRLAVALLSALVLGGCLSLPRGPAPAPPPGPPAQRDTAGAPPSYVVFGQRYYPMADSTGYQERGVASWYGTKFHGRNTANGEIYDMFAMTAAHKTLPLPTWLRVTNLRNGRSIVVRVNDRGPFVKNRLIDLSYEAAKRIDMIGAGTTLVEIETIEPPSQPVVAAATLPPVATPALPPTATATTTVATITPAPAATTTAVTITPAPAATLPPPTVVTAPPSGADDGPAAAVDTGTISLPQRAVAASADEATLPAADRQRIFVQVGAFGDFANAQRMRSTLYNAAIENVRLADGDREGQPVYRVQIGPVADVAEYDLLIATLETLGISETHLITEP